MLIKNAKIYLEKEVIDSGFIKIVDGKILDFGTMTDLSYKTSYLFDSDIVNAQGTIVAPGLIDQHTHGLDGKDYMDSADDPTVLYEMALQQAKEGVTSFLATTMTAPAKTIEKICKSVWFEMNNLTDRAPAAKLLGVHMEGPFINEKYSGAQDYSAIREPDASKFKNFYNKCEKTIRIITYAIEKDPECLFTKTLCELGVTPSCGHSAANSETVTKHYNAGLKCITHFHNAMSSMTAREPGVVVGGIINPIYIELIPDGIHVHPDVINATYIAKGADKIILITDSLRAKGLPDGTYDLAGQQFIKKGNECRIPNGKLAGSVLSLLDGVKNMTKFTGCSLHQAINMASANPAKNLGMFDRIGSIDKNKEADLIFLSQEGDLQLTIINGNISWKAK